MWFSKKAMKHSTIGDFKYKNGKPFKMLNGGHGQKNIDYLDKYEIAHNTAYQYKNGVRLGTVSIHDLVHCREKNKQCWFPKDWTDKDFYNAAKHVLSLKENANKKNSEMKVGFYKGIKVGVYSNGKVITTVFPRYDQRK